MGLWIYRIESHKGAAVLLTQSAHEGCKAYARALQVVGPDKEHREAYGMDSYSALTFLVCAIHHSDGIEHLVY